MMLPVAIVVFVGQVLAVLVLNKGLKRLNGSQAVDDLKNFYDTITVIIPFYNEGERIQPLLKRLNEMQIPSTITFIFVNDGSTDDTVLRVQNELKRGYVLINNYTTMGKKYAIKAGVEHADGEFIVTWDADVLPELAYFENLRINRHVDLLVLPVRMTGSSLIQQLGAIEFSFLQFLGFGMGGFGDEQLCNGANLGFSKAAFLEIDSQRTDYNMSSGDDMFLLAKMKESGKFIRFQISPDVTTPAPNSVKALLKQRRRWISKMKGIALNSLTYAGLLLFLTQVAFLMSVVGLFWSTWFFIPIALKFIVEFVVISRMERLTFLRVFVLLIYQFWYPIYIILLGLPLKKEERWALNRKLE